MRIELRHQYKSIVSLSTDELPDFAVLIGRNGAGKTQLLEALEQGQAVIPGIGVGEIEKYDMVSFRPANATPANHQSNQFAQATSDAYMLSQPGGCPLIQTATVIFEQFAGDIERTSGVQAREEFVRELRSEVQRIPDFNIFGANRQGSSYQKALYERVLVPINASRGGTSNQAANRFNGNRAALLSAAMKLTGKLPHELTHNDIMRASHYEGDTLSNSVSAAFTGYKINEYLSAHRRFETDRGSLGEFISDYRTENPPPWDTLREVLSEMRDVTGDDGLFDFEFSDPNGHDISLSYYQQYSFAAVMTNRTTGAQYDLESLSSGEKVLMALCLVSFNQHLGRRRPKLLLLDELDALLHPSMVAALVGTLKTLFVSPGTKVVMTSHSPMTVAALDEAYIFRVVRTGGQVEVFSTTKSEAIRELSEGLATVDVALRIAAYDEAKVTILTEGNNAKHLRRWAQLNFPEVVHVFEGLEANSSDAQLLTYGRLLAKLNTNTHFVIVWDCDATDKAETLRSELPKDTKVTPFAFARRENTIVRNGIENNYDEEILERYSTTTTGNDGTVLNRGFQSNRKSEFANHVLQQGPAEYFTHFRKLQDLVSEILRTSQEGLNP